MLKTYEKYDESEQMSKDLVQEFGENGFVILKNVFSEGQMEPLRRLTDEIVAYAEQELEDPFLSYYLKHRADQGALYDLFQRHPEFQAFAKSSEILDFLEGVLGPDIFLYENSLVYKPEGKRNEVPWHQDYMNRPKEPHKITAWMPLDKVAIANGAMKVVPGSHKLGFQPYFRVKGETHHTRLQLDQVDLSKAVYAEMNAGDVLIFHHLLIHSSDRIERPSARRVYRVAYQGFEQIFTPRGAPIVLRGGGPKALSKRYPRKIKDIPPRPFPVRFLHRLGNRLKRL